MKQKMLKLLLMPLLALGIGIQTPSMPTGSHTVQSTVVKAAKKHQSQRVKSRPLRLPASLMSSWLSLTIKERRPSASIMVSRILPVRIWIPVMAPGSNTAIWIV